MRQKKKIKRHKQAVRWLRKPSQAGEKRLLKQRDAQQQLQEPLGSREALTAKLTLNGEVNSWGYWPEEDHECHKPEVVDMKFMAKITKDSTYDYQKCHPGGKKAPKLSLSNISASFLATSA